MPTRGRSTTARGVHSFEDPGLFVPTELVLDTSFVVEALMPAQKHHASAALFLSRLADNGSTVFFNRLLELELAEAAFQIGLRERHGKNWKRARHDGRARRRADRVLDRVLAVWASVLSELSWSCIEVHEVVDGVPALMSRLGLASYDALHVATAQLVDVRDMVTLDAGFASVPASVLTLHVDATRVRRCRQLRAR
jgi:predicted nucleic acid-binding protein